MRIYFACLRPKNVRNWYTSRRFLTQVSHGSLHEETPTSVPEEITLRFAKIYCKEQDSAFWNRVISLRGPFREQDMGGAHSNAVTAVDFAEMWKPVVYASRMRDALEQLGQLGFSIKPSCVERESDQFTPRQDLPSWIPFYMIINQVQTAGDSAQFLAFIYAQLLHTPQTLKQPLLVLTAAALSRFAVLAPLRKLVEEFHALPHADGHTCLNTNLLLEALSFFPSSEEAVRLATHILRVMVARQIDVRSQTYLHLLSKRFATVPLTRELWRCMSSQHFTPSLVHLEAFLAVFSSHRFPFDVRYFMRRIRAQAFMETPGNVPLGRHLHQTDTTPGGSIHPAHTQYLQAFPHSAISSFGHLSRLLAAEHRLESKGSKARFSVPASPQRVTPPKNSVDIYQWTASLSVAARDRFTPASTLLRLFESSQEKLKPFKPTVATYTVVIRGLLHRKAYTPAVDLFYKLSTLFELDRKALTVGLQALTRAKRPHEAFAFLETYAAPASVAASSRLSEPGSDATVSHTQQAPVQMNIIAMNEFLISLTRIRRPDVVFQIWDHMELLYGIRPDAITLNILLMSARVASRSSNPFRGALAQIGSMFRKQPLAVPRLDRDGAVAHITSMMLDQHGKPRVGMLENGMWRGLPAWQVATEIFKTTILGNWPELKDLHPPAVAVRDSEDSPPMRELVRALAKPAERGQSRPPEADWTPVLPDAHPEIVPTDETFYRYIQILGTHDRIPEIPLTLAWMRALGINPKMRTLAVALVFWREVSLLAPLMDKWVGEERCEFRRLATWMLEWVGRDKMPTPADVEDWIVIVEKMRRGGRYGSGLPYGARHRVVRKRASPQETEP